MQQKITTLMTTLFVSAMLFSSCTSSRSAVDVQQAKIAEFKRDEYVLLDQVTASSGSFRFWLLFIPIGGRSDQRLYDNAYQSAVKLIPEADGLIKPRYEYKKVSIPLILIGFTSKKVTVTGKGYRLKSEDEIKSSVSNPSTSEKDKTNTTTTVKTVVQDVKYTKGQTVKFKHQGEVVEGQIDAINEEKKSALIKFDYKVFKSTKTKTVEVPFKNIFN